jgi:hypothetical protein
MKVQQQFEAEVALTDKYGNPAQIDGDPVWTIDNPTLLVIAPIFGNPNKVLVSSGTTTGVSQLSCTADVDLGDGMTTITGTLLVTVHSGDAVMVTISPTGDPVDAPIDQGRVVKRK